MRTQCFEMLVECGVYCDFPFAVKTKDKQTDSLMYLYFTTAEERKQKRKSALTTLTWQNKKTPHNEVDTLSIYSPARANGYANLKGDCFSFSMLPSGMTFYDRQIILVHFRLIFCTRNSQLFTVVATINRSTSQFCVCFFSFLLYYSASLFAFHQDIHILVSNTLVNDKSIELNIYLSSNRNSRKRNTRSLR